MRRRRRFRRHRRPRYDLPLVLGSWIKRFMDLTADVYRRVLERCVLFYPRRRRNTGRTPPTFKAALTNLPSNSCNSFRCRR